LPSLSLTHPLTRIGASKSLESADLKESRFQAGVEGYQKSLDEIDDEWADRNVSRARFQVEASALSAPIGLPGKELGVFGVPMGDGEYHGILGDAGHLAGADDHDIHVFSSDPYPTYEMKTMKFYDDKSELERSQALYDSLQQDSNFLGMLLFICQNK